MKTDTDRINAVLEILKHDMVGSSRIPLTDEQVADFCNIMHYPDSCQMHKICLSMDEAPGIKLDLIFGAAQGEYTYENMDDIDAPIHGILRIFTPQNRDTPKMGIKPGVILGSQVVWGLPEDLFALVHDALRDVFGDHTTAIGMFPLNE